VLEEMSDSGPSDLLVPGTGSVEEVGRDHGRPMVFMHEELETIGQPELDDRDLQSHRRSTQDYQEESNDQWSQPTRIATGGNSPPERTSARKEHTHGNKLSPERMRVNLGRNP